MKLFVLMIAVVFCSKLAMAQESTTRPTKADYLRLADETESNLQNQILAKWFPGALDEKGGGFFQNYNEDWSRGRATSKGIVYQSRLTWTSAMAAMRYPDKADMYLAQSRAGLKFISEKLWDSKDGGFFWAVDDNGKPPTPQDARKQGYGNAFAIYAAATNYKATHDQAALDLAKKAFKWFDEHGRDAKNTGYLEVIPAPNEKATADTGTNPVGAAAGQKSMNTSIHVLEALSGLYEIWPDPTVKLRLQEMFEINRDKIFSEPGYLIMFFESDWKPRPGPDSYGHDVETAYLLVEAATALGIPDDAKTWTVARKIMDHAISVAVDRNLGGLYNEGAVEGGNFSSEREWWVEAEFLNALLLMHEKYGKETNKYWDEFLREWSWINNYQIDKTNGGWIPRVMNNGMPTHRGKSDQWTECYHQGRAMMTVTDRLRKLASQP